MMTFAHSQEAAAQPRFHNMLAVCADNAVAGNSRLIANAPI